MSTLSHKDALRIAESSHNSEWGAELSGQALRTLAAYVGTLRHEVECANYATKEMSKSSMKLERRVRELEVDVRRLEGGRDGGV